MAEDVPDPVPGPGEVVIAVGAASVNFPDLLVVDGSYQNLPERPFTPGKEAAGRVVAVGDGVERIKVGQRVLTLVEHGKNEVRARIPVQDVASLQKAREPVFRQGERESPVKVLRIAPVVDARAQTREVILGAEQPLVSGSSGELSWASSTPYLPAAYLQRHEARLGVWVEEGGKPVFKPVPDAQTGRPVALDWPLSTRIVDQGRFALTGPAVIPDTSSASDAK